MPTGAGRRSLPQGSHLCWLLCAFTLKLCQAEAPVRAEKLSVSTSNLPCWQVEEFVVAEECAPCSNFQAKTTPECGSTGYVEKITCSSSKRNELKRYRLAYWKGGKVCEPKSQFCFWITGPIVRVNASCVHDHTRKKLDDIFEWDLRAVNTCRSALMEQHLFWKFEGAVVGVALVFACLVIVRQRQLDRKALEKVRKQIESI